MLCILLFLYVDVTQLFVPDDTVDSPAQAAIFILAISTPNTANDDFISFLSNSTHALCNAAELLANTLHDDRSSMFAHLGDDGWMIGPKRRLLFWVPTASRGTFRYDPRISDLERMRRA